ncbi:hypothetical protein DID88_001200 [Monilinia fructigena]|uniref:NADP-dependent oxidoreductase domain-containing protein n=1 Tax=Monilinia fructigena TaxID=38457 RepID=A0A395J082_9HELO|nr:hypothetical protein DID88_001200 [Monilinia fructigena]
MVQLLGKDIGTTGYGMMGLSWRPEPQPLEETLVTLKAALESGCNFWNGGQFYGTPEYNSLTICEAYFTKYPEDAEKVVLSVKGGIDLERHVPDGSPEGIFLNAREWIAVRLLKITMKVLEEEYVKTGKIGGISLSECSAETVQRAAKVTKIVACEVELSLTTTDIFQNGVAKACAEHDILVVAYSPLGRGLLTGAIQKPEDIPEGDHPCRLSQIPERTLRK